MFEHGIGRDKDQYKALQMYRSAAFQHGYLEAYCLWLTLLRKLQPKHGISPDLIMYDLLKYCVQSNEKIIETLWGRLVK